MGQMTAQPGCEVSIRCSITIGYPVIPGAVSGWRGLSWADLAPACCAVLTDTHYLIPSPQPIPFFQLRPALPFRSIHCNRPSSSLHSQQLRIANDPSRPLISFTSNITLTLTTPFNPSAISYSRLISERQGLTTSPPVASSTLLLHLTPIYYFGL